jgi:hypothetical protein
MKRKHGGNLILSFTNVVKTGLLKCVSGSKTKERVIAGRCGGQMACKGRVTKYSPDVGRHVIDLKMPAHWKKTDKANCFQAHAPKEKIKL